MSALQRSFIVTCIVSVCDSVTPGKIFRGGLMGGLPAPWALETVFKQELDETR